MPVTVGFLIIFGLPLLLLKLRHLRQNQKGRKEAGLDVKKRLITAENYSALDPNVLMLMKSDIFIRHMRELLLCIPVMALLKHSESAVYISIVSAFGIIAAIIVFGCLSDMRSLSSRKDFIKIKGFVFGQIGTNELLVLYYDMEKLDYRVFRQNIWRHKADAAQLGSFVNLIGIRTAKRVKIIRILSF